MNLFINKPLVSLCVLIFFSTSVYSQDSSSIEPTPVERGRETEDRSVLHQKKGIFTFGTTKVNLEDFHSLELPQNWFTKISFRTDLLLLARVENRGRSEKESGDTVWIKKPSRTILKKALKIYKNKKDKDKNRYGWDFINRRGMGSHCPPSQCYHYFIAYTSKGEWIEIREERDINKLIPAVKSYWDAVFLISNDIYGINRMLFSSTNKGWQILLNDRIRDCPITYADKLYIVDNKGAVNELGSNVSRVTNLCY